MAKYQLLYGIHSDVKSGKKFTAGDIIESEKNLVEAFGSNKFRKLSEEEAQDYQPCCMANCVRTIPAMNDEQPKKIKKIKGHKVINIQR